LPKQVSATSSATAAIYYLGHGWRDTAINPPAYNLISTTCARTSCEELGLLGTLHRNIFNPPPADPKDAEH